MPMYKSNHILLAPITREDLPILWDWINDRDLVLFSAPYTPIHADQHHKWFEAIQQRTDIAIFGIHLQEDSKLIGSCQLHNINYVHRTAELQIRIGDRSEHGKGYGTETVRLLLKFAFQDLNLQRVSLHVFSTNLAAMQLYKKVGFTQEGTLRRAAYIDGEYLDVIVLGMLREEYAIK